MIEKEIKNPAPKVIALAGNPNSGKTTLFNALTKMHQKVGNWTGVTVEKKEGFYYKDKSIILQDLPGTYSLSPYSKEEEIVGKYIVENQPNVVLNIVDGTNLERNLFLTCQLAMLKVPMVIVVNMADDLEKNGITIDTKKLSELFNSPVVMVSALKNKDFDELIETALNNKNVPHAPTFQHCDSEEYTQRCYDFLAENVKDIITVKETKGQKITQKIDKVLTHKIWGIPIFACVMFLMYFVSIYLGQFLNDYVALLFEKLGEATSNGLINAGAPEWLNALLVDAIINGVGSVISFLPQILLLFTFMSLLESCGYMARVAFIMDRIFKKFGLSGKSLIPMMVSCGCIVPGVMSTRVIENANERKMTVYLSAFMPCSAKMVIFAYFAAEFFLVGSALIATSMYFLAIVSVIIGGLILKNFKGFKSEADTFILELPTYRTPDMKELLHTLWEKTKGFLVKAGTVIFAVSVVLWLLQSFSFTKGYVGGDIESSILASIGSVIKYIFYPLGFASWESAVAVITGFFAKEAVIETLEVVGSTPVALFKNGFTAYSFMAFCLLSAPCVAAIGAIKKELGGFKGMFKAIGFQTLFAYVVALLINGVGALWNLNSGIFITVVCVLAVLVVLFFAIRHMVKGKDKCLCGGCNGDCKACSYKKDDDKKAS